MLSFGIGREAGREPRAYGAIGDHAVDLHTLATRADIGAPAAVFAQPTLNDFLALGRDSWRAVGAAVSSLFDDAIHRGGTTRRDQLPMLLPVDVGDYVDMYAGIHHATNLGRLFRPEGDPLLPNWRHVPVGYHGRAGTVVVSGTDVVRPRGHTSDRLHATGVEFGASRQLDIELELGFVIGTGSARSEPTAIDDFGEHVFGMVLVNDWSARDIQAFEYQPLGPFLGKSFMTSVSPWIVPLDALAPSFVSGLAGAQEPPPAAHLRSERPSIPDLHLEVALQTAAMRARGEPPEIVSTVDAADALYWSPAQQLAHATSNGASVRTGDLFASGTLSGPDSATQGGSLIELSEGGRRPLTLPSGEPRSFLEDGDRVVMRGWTGRDDTRIGFGTVEGTVVPAPQGG